MARLLLAGCLSLLQKIDLCCFCFGKIGFVFQKKFFVFSLANDKNNYIFEAHIQSTLYWGGTTFFPIWVGPFFLGCCSTGPDMLH